MPPADSGPVSGTSRPLPRVLLIVAAALLVARVATGVWEEKHAPEPVDLVPWADTGSALAESQRTTRPVLYVFTADGDGPSEAMAREVFADEAAAGRIQQSYIPVRVIDRRQGRNAPGVDPLKQQYRVTDFPTLVVARPGDAQSVALRGYRGREATVSWLASNAMFVRMRLLNTAPDSVLRR